MKRIIIPTDFSETAWNATLHALEYCKILHAELHLIHVYQYSPNDLNVNTQLISEAIDKAEKEMLVLMDKIQDTRNYTDVKLISICDKGTILNSLLALNLNPIEDLLIMGTEGRKGAVARLLGSQTSRLMEDIKCPILIIPPHAKFSLSSSITCAIDYSSKIKSPDLQLLEELVNAGTPNNVKLIHIIRVRKDTHQKLPLEQFTNFKVSYNEIIGDDISTLLEGYSSLNKSRLLVIVRQEKGFFEKLFQASVSNKLTINANVPLLILSSK